MDLRVRALVHRLPKWKAEATAVLAKIQAHESQLAKNPAAVMPRCCPACREAATLRKHELRRRSFWFVVSHQVERAVSFVLRVTCAACNHRTTVLPSFALPHKRYVLSEVVDSGDRYLLDDNATYESATQVDDRPVFHDAEGASRARSTVHRWVGFLGSLVTLLANATELALQANPAFSPLAEMVDFSPRRYRTDARRKLLAGAQRLLRVRTCLLKATSGELFPSIATAAAWT